MRLFGNGIDIKMPEIDGVELARRMFEIKPKVKIVFISAYAQNEEEVRAKLQEKEVDFCHKPYSSEKLKKLIAKLNGETSQPKIFLRTFDSFDLFIEGIVVDFPSKKAKELLALLVDARGSYVTMDTAIGNLWPNKNVELGKRLYRDAVCKLRLKLKEWGADNLVVFEHARCVINMQIAKCDMWDFVKEGGTFSGRYMPLYDWSIITESMLENLKNKK